MQVTSFQMHSVLECYSRKLSARRTGDASSRKFPAGGVLSAEGSREATMDKISRQVLEKISDVVSLSRPREDRPLEPRAFAGDDATDGLEPFGTGADEVGSGATAARGGADTGTIPKTDSWV